MFLPHTGNSAPHSGPLHPTVHVHVYAATASLHVAPFWHGALAQSLMFWWHLSPFQPLAHMHVNAFTRSMHVPAF